MRRCGGGCIHNPSEGVKPPAAWLRAEHRRSAHAIRCTTDFCSSRRNARGTLASYSSLGDGRDGTSPGGGPRIPFPHTRMNPGSIDVTPPNQNESSLQRPTAVSRETGSQPPGRAHHICPFSPAAHVVTIGFAVLPQCTALDQHLPKQPYLPHSSISAQRLPSHRTRRTRRPTSSIHIAAESGSSSRATAHDGSTSGKESPSVHQCHPAT